MTNLPVRDLPTLMRLVAVAVGAAALVWVAMPLAGSAQADEQVYVVEVTDTIDLGLAPFLQRIVDRAESEGATVVVHIDTPGGRLDAALQMRETLLEADIPTLALVDRTALSAGALIAMSAERIHLVEGAVIGAATPVVGSGETADQKTISAVRGVFRSTAETRGRDPVVAEAMVDPAVEIPDLVASDELLTLSVPEATEWGYADAVVDGLDASIAEAGLSGAAVTVVEPSAAESLVRWLTNPVVASLLITVGMWLLIGDVLAGGLGIPALAGLGLIALFFFGHLLAGLAGWEDVALVVVGLVLIGLEIAVVPGTGIIGFLGLAAFLGGAFLAMLGRELVTGDQIQTALSSVAVALVLILAGTAVLFSYLARGGGPRGLVLQDAVGKQARASSRGWTRWIGGDDADESPQPTEEGSLEGSTGVAVTDLRPGGIARVDGRRLDVVTEGDHIPVGTSVEVVADHGYRRVVRAVPESR